MKKLILLLLFIPFMFTSCIDANPNIEVDNHINISIDGDNVDIKILVANGANILAKDNDGALPFDLLKTTEFGDAEVAQEGSEIYEILNPARALEEVSNRIKSIKDAENAL